MARPLLTPLPWLLALHLTGALAQTPTAETVTTTGIEQRAERIRHEDALTRVDELRVGGQTRSITVQPKNGAPAYEVTPATGAQEPGLTRNDSSGKSRWRLLDF